MKACKQIIFLAVWALFALDGLAQYTVSSPLTLDGASNQTITGKEFQSGSGGASILLKNCKNIKIVNCRFINIPTYVGIQLQNCTNVEITDCYFDTFKGGVYAVSSTGINVHCNSFKTIKGPRPRGQIVQFNGVSGSGNRINYNILEHVLGTGDPEDLINAYASSGTSYDPLQIIGNKLRGGGPSTSGGGIMVGDNGGHDIIVADNILVDPGQYGIGAPAGYNITIKNNKIYAKQQSFTNVGIYVGLAGEIAAGFPCQGNTFRVENNQVNWTNKNGIKNGWYNCSCCSGVIQSGNNFNAPITSAILPATLSLDAEKCSSSTPANQPPSVTLTSPANQTSFTAPATINLSASASDSDGTISKIEFYNGSTFLGSDNTPPYTFTWSNVPSGTYSLTAKATDNSGSSSGSGAVTVNVSMPVSNKVPVISFETPVNNSSYTAPMNFYIKVNAFDEDGTISEVNLYMNGVFVRKEGLVPYEWGEATQNDPLLKSVSAGTYIFKAVAIDNEGAQKAAEITVTIKDSPATNQAPSLSISSPSGNSVYTAPATVSIAASASDTDGSISKVDFYNGSNLLGTDLSTPYAFTWNNVSAGSYTINVTATDDKGFKTTKSIGITVNPPASNTIGINGPGCISAGASYSYSITPDPNYTTIQWWTNSGATITQNSSDPKKIDIFVPGYLNGTSFTLTSGVNFSTSPWYREYTKTIKVGGCSSKLSAVVTTSTAEGNTTIELENEEIIKSIIIFNSQGSKVFHNDQVESSTFFIDSKLAAGMYILHIQSEQGSSISRFVKE